MYPLVTGINSVTMTKFTTVALEKHGNAKFHVDIKEEGVRGSDLNVQ